MRKGIPSRTFESGRSVGAQGRLILPKSAEELKREDMESERLVCWAMLDCDRFWRHYDSLDRMAKVRLEAALHVIWSILKAARP